MDLDEVSPLTFVQTVLRQRIDVLLDQGRPVRRGTAEFHGAGDSKVPRTEGGQSPGSDWKGAGKEAPNREGACPRTMANRALTSRVVAHFRVCSETRSEQNNLVL